MEHRPGASITIEEIAPGAEMKTPNRYSGRIPEVLPNGRYEGKSRLDRVADWDAFWKSLLDAKDEDAAGMIRRVSASFAVRKA